MDADTRFIWDSYHDRYFEVIGETDSSGPTTHYACSYDNVSITLVIMDGWVLVGAAHATIGRLRGAKLHFSNPSSIADARGAYKLKGDKP